MLHTFLLDQDAVRGVTSGCGMIDVPMVSSDLSPDVRLDTVSGDNKITFDPKAVLKLNSNLQVIVTFDNFLVWTNILGPAQTSRE